jgi:hypothetical protein
MKAIVNELGNVKSTDFGPRTGGFNVLNVPDELYVTPKQFWGEYKIGVQNRGQSTFSSERGSGCLPLRGSAHLTSSL